MRALTVRQPWALHIVQSGKDVENRSRNIAGAYRGPVAIHAGLHVDEEALRKLPRLPPNGIPRVFFYGFILGVVDLVGVHAMWADDEGKCDRCDSPWAQQSPYHLMLANPRRLRKPISVRGRLGLWTLPDDIAAQVEEALR
jgi:hypothetical protein